MIDVLAMLPAFVAGWLIVRLIARLGWFIEIPLGVGLGAGLSSAIFFILTWAGVTSRYGTLAIEILVIAIAAAFAFRIKEPHAPARGQSWILRIAVILAVAIAAMDVSQSLASDPDGGYDAAAIWNIRARYLAGGPSTWHYAVSDKTGTNHPGYPLLVPGFVARTWVLIGDLRSSTPAALSVIFSLATVALLAAAAESEILGWLAALVLLATEGFVSQASIQYADIPLSFFILATVALFAIASKRDSPPGLVALAGIFASLAAWTKNEGLPFLAFASAVVLWRSLRSAKWFAMGAAPVLLLTLVFKFALVEGREQMFPSSLSQALKMMTGVSRWTEIIASFAKNFWEMGFPWAHPFLLLAILAWAFGFAKERRWWLLIPPLGLLASDFGIYLITMSGLTWHLGTSNNRVIVQVWPALIFAFFALLQPPAGVRPAKR